VQPSSFTSFVLGLAGSLACSAPGAPPESPSTPTATRPDLPGSGAPVATSAPANEVPKRGCACQLKLDNAPATAAAPLRGELPRPPFDLERRSACVAPVCRLDSWLPDQAFVDTTREGVPSQGAVWLETLADQSTLVLPPHADLESVALVLEGQVAYGEGERSKTAGAPVLSAWGVLRASNAGISLSARGGKASVLIAVLSRHGTLSEAIERGRRKDAPKPGKTALEVSDLTSSPKLDWGHGTSAARVAFATSGIENRVEAPRNASPPGGATGVSNGASVSLLQMSGHAELPETVHSTEWEHIAIVRGSGELVLGNARYPVTPGAIFHVPRGVVHGWKGRGDDLAAITIFSPGGPEQRYLDAAAQENGTGAAPATGP
jgi:quercetin dioxygenase-like cupin family protein